MTRAESLLYRRRALLWITAALLIIGGGVLLSLVLIHRETSARQEAISEANLRGEAVSTLAGDVRALREQVKAKGETPVAPDPTRAVEDLPDRAEVPVPIPGPRGPAGEPGRSGASGRPGGDGADGSDGAAGADGRDGGSGPSGAPGADGAVGPQGPSGPQGEQGEPGVSGPQGEPGPAGADGKDGVDGQNCPDGYSLQPPPGDPDGLMCRRDGAPDPGDDDPPQAAALDPQRRQYA
ncbi:collagen-like domain-containing protein [Streptomyces lasiicapitis]|uniref:collagen-like protein n=1 Tax=Streptomyces lasiicapitis TaxID=1923961 RepID=UPI0036495126